MDARLTTMTPKEAIALAKAAVGDLFSDEAISGVRLEEIRYDDLKERWLITVGFARAASDEDRYGLFKIPAMAQAYKVVTVQDQTGKVLSVTNWSADQP